MPRSTALADVIAVRAMLGPLLQPASPISPADTELDELLGAWAEAERSCPARDRPFVTLAYAQSLDGCIATDRGKTTAISGPASLRLTHALRARHDGILIGIGTLLADDPRLDVRLVEGASPRPIVVDSHLACPPDARLLQRRSAALFASTRPSPDKRAALEAKGAEIWQLPTSSWPQDAGWVDLPELLARLRRAGIARLMVEGGARILTSFLWAGLADYAVITLSPQWLGGLSAVDAPHGRELRDAAGPSAPRLAHPRSRQLGDDVVVTGMVVRSVGHA